jgi:uncharacterized protein YbjQ (UPF0145 family)
MSVWVLILATTAIGGALVVWHTVSRIKQFSDQMLDKYSQILAEAREQKSKDLAGKAGDESTQKAAEG